MAKKLVIETTAEINDDGKVNLFARISLEGKVLEEIRTSCDSQNMEDNEPGGHIGLILKLRIDEKLNSLSHLINDFGA